MNHQSIDLFLAANVQRSQLLGKESSAASAEWAPVATQGLGCSQPTWDQWIRLETLQETLGFTMKYRCFFGKKMQSIKYEDHDCMNNSMIMRTMSMKMRIMSINMKKDSRKHGEFTNQK